jgi:hypothetical protein
MAQFCNSIFASFADLQGFRKILNSVGRISVGYIGLISPPGSGKIGDVKNCMVAIPQLKAQLHKKKKKI